MANRYENLLLHVFRGHNPAGNTQEFVFEREEIVAAAAALGMQLPKNLGDVIYSFRYRNSLPEEIASTAPAGCEWLIEPAGRGTYRFVIRRETALRPREDLLPIKIPDATPEIINRYALNDEQALLARLRYNRLVDLFLGVTAYSLQNHLRTTVTGIGQIEIDELYVGVNRTGSQFIIPVQAKGEADRVGAVQARQDVLFCQERYPLLVCRPLAAQTIRGNRVALFELALANDEVMVVEERHYQLVPADQISDEDLRLYRSRNQGTQ